MEVKVVNITEQQECSGLTARPPSGLTGSRGKKLTQYIHNNANMKENVPSSSAKVKDDFSIGNGYNGVQQAIVCCDAASKGKTCSCLATSAREQRLYQPKLACKKSMKFHNTGIPMDIQSPVNFNRPSSAKVINAKYETKHKRPVSAHTLGDKKLQTGIIPEPFVYGYSSGKNVSGSLGYVPADYQYSKKQIALVPPKPVFRPSAYDNDDATARVPKSLEALLPWLTTNVPKELIGIEPEKCFVFLPSLCSEYDELPVVPSPLKNKDELPYCEDVTTPRYAPAKKYDHPSWNKLHLDENKCMHNGPPSLVRIFGRNGDLLHESIMKNRTADVIRKEIKELEDLMRGIGSEDGCSIIVQYQFEIDKLKRTVNNTIGRVEEIEQRLAEEAAKKQPKDHFGMKRFYQEHDDIMKEIWKQRNACMQELEELEGGI